jgi:hypothetical protein
VNETFDYMGQNENRKLRMVNFICFTTTMKDVHVHWN